MARLKALEPAEIDPSCKGIVDDFMKERGAIPNMFRTFAHDPELLRNFFALFRSALRDAEVPTRLKELIAVRVSHLNRSRY